MSAARDAVLARVRYALGPGSGETTMARDYRREGQLDAVARIELLCERVADYRADVRRVSAAELPAAILAAFTERGAARVGIPAGIPAAWRVPGLEFVEDAELSPAELDRLDGVLTGCTLAIAETGTLILTAGPTEGRRALTLVPDLHVCVLDEAHVVELVPEAIAALGERQTRPLTLISGPSATSDIELSRVEGVHGPRALVVIVVSA